MKKIIIAAAVVGAFASTAQAQTSVTLYGIADVAVRMDRGGANGSFTHLVGGDLAPTRWGIRGSENLGGGLRANFNFEQAINSDNGIQGGGLADGFNRLSVVGVSGAFGNIRAGVDYSPHWRAYSGLFSTATLAAPFGGKPAAYIGGSTRMKNGIFYDSPVMSGLSLRAAYSFNEGGTESAVAATKRDGSSYSLAAIYGSGPIQFSLGHHNTQNSATVDTKANTIGGAYDFKVAKLFATMNTNKNTGATINTASYLLGVYVPVGKFTVRAAVASYNDKTAANADAKFFGLTGLYALSPRTTAYANYGRLNNNANAALNMTGSLSTAVLGSNMSGISAGVSHSF